MYPHEAFSAIRRSASHSSRLVALEPYPLACVCPNPHVWLDDEGQPVHDQKRSCWAPATQDDRLCDECRNRFRVLAKLYGLDV